MGVFIGLVFVAYVYIWRKGGLDWSSDQLTPVDEPAAIAEPHAPTGDRKSVV